MAKDPIVEKALESLERETNRDIRDDMYMIKPIARLYSDYKEKFGIPRQSGIVNDLRQLIAFEPEFSNPDAVRGLEGFTYIWLIWGFSETRVDMEAEEIEWLPKVRPPRLGGKVKMGVWATRSPYRPNSLGLSCVRIEAIEPPYIVVSGADLMNGTPIYDIKPYMPDSECKTDARGGFTEQLTVEAEDGERVRHSGDSALEVFFPEELIQTIPEEKHAGLIKVLSLDPRGAYEKKSGYTYGLAFAGYDIKFYVEGDRLFVTGVEEPGK